MRRGRWHESREILLARAAEIENLLQHRRQGADLLHLFAEAGIADGEPDLCLLDGKRELAGAQQRHGRDRDPASLHHR